MYNYMQTHIDTMHTYDRHDDITQLKQPEANNNKCKLNLNDGH